MLEADVCIIGTGAGGGIAADVLSSTGLKVVMIEEGMLKSSTDFACWRPRRTRRSIRVRIAQDRRQGDQHPAGAHGRWFHHSELDQQLSHANADAQHWRERFGLTELTDEHMAGWFKLAEQLLSIPTGRHRPAEQQHARTRGQKIGVKVERIRRNVKGCYNLAIAAWVRPMPSSRC